MNHSPLGIFFNTDISFILSQKRMSEINFFTAFFKTKSGPSMPTALFILFSALLIPAPTRAGETLSAVMDRGRVICGSSTGTDAYAIQKKGKDWQGMDVDFCRAVAAAVLGQPDRIRIVDASGTAGERALKEGDIDVLLGPVIHTARRDAAHPFTPAGILLFSRQAFLAHWEENADSMEAYRGTKVCLSKNSGTRPYLESYMRHKDLDLHTIVLANRARAREFFLLKRCDLYADDIGILLGSRQLRDLPASLDVVLLPETIAMTPIAPHVHEKDPQWADSIRWIRNALVRAEFRQVTARNVKDLGGQRDRELETLAGTREDMGTYLGLDANWARRAIKAAGNYGEIYARNLGENTELKLDREKNRLWNDGGLIYAPPLF